MKSIALALSVLALSAGAALAQGDKRLAALDANNDGQITLEEARAPRLEMFARIDANGDGQITQAEADAFRTSRRAERPEGAPDGARRDGRRHGGSPFERLDANKDGAVARDEFVNGPTPLFDRFDANKNGVLEAAELAQIPQRGAR